MKRHFGTAGRRRCGRERSVRGRGLRALLLGSTLLAPIGHVLHAQELTTTQISRRIQGEEDARVTVRTPAGRVWVSGADTPQLFSVQLRYDADRVQPLQEVTGTHFVLGMSGTGGRPNLLPHRSGVATNEFRLTLTNRIPLDLTLEMGAVESEVDLGGLRLNSFTVSTGATDGQLRLSTPNPESMSQAQINIGAAAFRGTGLGHLNAAEIEVNAGVGDIVLDFEGLARAETRLRVQMGVGSLRIQLPPGVGIRLSRRSLLVALTAPGLERRGNELYSPNWDEAEMRIRIEVGAGIGSLTVVSGIR
jgi:hypothetical protein